MEFHHIPVMLHQVVEALAIRPDGIYVDGTLGGGGHAREIAARLGSGGRLIGIDQDPNALAAAGERLRPYIDRCTLVRSNFARLDQVLRELEIRQVNGIFLDIGVSSHQFDEAERGFTYRHDVPLDMRMDPDGPTTAADLLNSLDEAELARIIAEYGEEKFARRIARVVVRQREQQGPIATTGQLVELIKQAIPAPARREGPHPARRTFQALRIAVNDELGVLERVLDVGVDQLAPGGRFAVITFHSLEDRIVKQRFAALAKTCICPPEYPACMCSHQARVRLVGKQPWTPAADEVAANPRARSAKLRVAERLPA